MPTPSGAQVALLRTCGRRPRLRSPSPTCDPSRARRQGSAGPLLQAFDVRVTLSQRFGAVAFGSTQGACTGDQAPFTIKVHTQFGTALIDAPVDVCALGILVGKHGILDTKQWCQDGALVDGADGR